MEKFQALDLAEAGSTSGRLGDVITIGNGKKTFQPVPRISWDSICILLSTGFRNEGIESLEASI
jgi:hypothetical protein